MSRFNYVVGGLALWVIPFTWMHAQGPGVGAQAGQVNPGAAGQAGFRAGGTLPSRVGPYTVNFGGIRQNPWFADRGVRQQLRINDDQFNQLNRNYSDAWTRYNQGVTGLGRDLNAEQRQQKMREFQGSFQRDFTPNVDRHFSDAQQRQRYNQLHLQYQGFDAFNDPAVQKRMNLSNEQSQALNALSTEWNTQLGTMGRDFRTDAAGTNKRFGEVRKQYHQRLNAILKEEQQQAWRETAGEPYEFPASVYFESDGDVQVGDRPSQTSAPRNALPR